MNASTPPEFHRACICMGSNIDPERNMRAGLLLLRERAEIEAVSTCWETEAVSAKNAPEGSAPNFLNLAACIRTTLSPAELKDTLLSSIERNLGRVRTTDKYASRTMDLDITVYDGQVLDGELWRRLYLALCFAELLPNLRHPETGESLAQAAERLRKGHLARPRTDLFVQDQGRHS